jgi:hypothetical protein
MAGVAWVCSIWDRLIRAGTPIISIFFPLFFDILFAFTWPAYLLINIL